MTPNIGTAFFSITMTATARMGSAPMSTMPKSTLSIRSITVPPIKKTGARTNILSTASTRSTRRVTSFVIRVTSEPVVNLSVCSTDSAIT